MDKESSKGGERPESNTFETIVLNFGQQNALVDTESILAALNAAGLSPHTICQWVPTRERLGLVSGDVGERLTEDILASWCRNGLRVIAVRGKGGEPLGFCTLSRTESPGMTQESVELCHLIVDPAKRDGAWIARHIVKSACSVAYDVGAKCLVGRVVPDNRPIHRLATSLGASSIIPLPEWADKRFEWYSIDTSPRPMTDGNAVSLVDIARSLIAHMMRFFVGLAKFFLGKPVRFPSMHSGRNL